MRILVFLLSCLTVVNAGLPSGSHSLMASATYIIGQTQFPEFSVLLMLDDRPLMYYDSKAWSVFYRSDSKYYDEEKNDAAVNFHDLFNSMMKRALYLIKHLNRTDGVHVYQKLVGCELLSNDKPGQLQTQDAFDRQIVEQYTFDADKNDIQMKMPWMMVWDQLEMLRVKLLHENIYYPVCIKALRQYLNRQKNSVLRKVKPRVRLIKKNLPGLPGVQITCLATGFYPRHINLTLSRDGQSVGDDQITGGELLPNGDGTYQMRKSLVISAEELHEGHKYQCTANHLSLDNKLDIKLDVKADLGSSTLSIIIIVMVLICVAVLIITAIIIWRKRHAAGKDAGSLQCDYSPTSTSVNEHEK